MISIARRTRRTYARPSCRTVVPSSSWPANKRARSSSFRAERPKSADVERSRPVRKLRAAMAVRIPASAFLGRTVRASAIARRSAESYATHAPRGVHGTCVCVRRSRRFKMFSLANVFDVLMNRDFHVVRRTSPRARVMRTFPPIRIAFARARVYAEAFFRVLSPRRISITDLKNVFVDIFPSSLDVTPKPQYVTCKRGEITVFVEYLWFNILLVNTKTESALTAFPFERLSLHLTVHHCKSIPINTSDLSEVKRDRSFICMKCHRHSYDSCIDRWTLPKPLCHRTNSNWMNIYEYT